MKEFTGGAVAALVGIGFAAHAWMTLDLGTFRRMGPGLFPVIVGAALLVLGLAQMLVARRARRAAAGPDALGAEDEGGFRLGQIAWVLAAVVAFGLSVRSLGLLPAILISVLLSTRADRSTRPRAALLLGAALCLFCWLVFDLGLRLPIPLLRLPF